MLSNLVRRSALTNQEQAMCQQASTSHTLSDPLSFLSFSLVSFRVPLCIFRTSRQGTTALFTVTHWSPTHYTPMMTFFFYDPSFLRASFTIRARAMVVLLIDVEPYLRPLHKSRKRAKKRIRSTGCRHLFPFPFHSCQVNWLNCLRASAHASHVAERMHGPLKSDAADFVLLQSHATFTSFFHTLLLPLSLRH